MRGRQHRVPSAAILPIIEVTWVDAFMEPNDSADLKQPKDIKEFGRLPEIQDVGYLIRWNRQEIVLAVSRCQADNDVRHSNSIPRSLIRDIKVLDGELPCPLTSIIPMRAHRISTISRPGSSPMSDPTTPSTKVNSSMTPRVRPSKPSSNGPSQPS